MLYSQFLLKYAVMHHELLGRFGGCYNIEGLGAVTWALILL